MQGAFFWEVKRALVPENSNSVFSSKNCRARSSNKLPQLQATLAVNSLLGCNCFNSKLAGVSKEDEPVKAAISEAAD